MMSQRKTSQATVGKKRIISKISELERKYGKDRGVANDEALWSYFRGIGFGSLSDLLRND